MRYGIWGLIDLVLELALLVFAFSVCAGFGYLAGKQTSDRWYRDHPRPCVNFTPERHWP